jgi:hypothetical protein
MSETPSQDEGQRPRWRAVAVLAIAAGLGSLIYWFAYSHPYNLFELYDHPLYDLLRHSKVAPNARWLLLAAFLAQGSLYLVSWRMARHARGRLAWIVVLGGALVSATILMFMFPIGAADIFDYIMYGRIVSVYGANPFFSVGREFPSDPFFAYIAWRNLPSTYGPLWVLVAGAAAQLAGDGIIANVLMLKLFIGFFFAGSIGLVAATLRKVAPDRTLSGVLALAWNPVVLYETFGNGHNDIVMMFLVLAAVWFLTHRRYTLAILALVASALVKYIPLLLVPAAGLIVLRDLPGIRARLRFVFITGCATIALLVLAYLPFWNGLETITIAKRQSLFTTSLPAALWAWLEPKWGSEYTTTFVGWGAAALTVLFVLWQSFCAWRDRSWASFPRAAFWILTLYLLFTCLWFQEWYTIWPAALAAVLHSDRAVLLAAMLNLGGLTKPYVFGPMWIWRDPLPSKHWWELRLGPTVLALPWLSLLVYLVTGRRRDKSRRSKEIT